MNRTRRIAITVISTLACGFALSGSALAEEEPTLPAPLPFDPLVLEAGLPGSTINNNLWGVRSLPSSSKSVGGVTYEWNGQTKTVFQMLLESGTDAFLAVDNGKIAYERYFDFNTAFTRHHSWSMMKSFTSAMIGIAIDDGYIDSVDDLVTDYVPQLAGNGYAGVTIKQALQMSSGVDYYETPSDPLNADALSLFIDPIIDNYTLGVAGRTYDEYATSPEWVQTAPPGTVWRYSSLESQVLGMVLSRATSRPVRQYLEQTIWKPAGMGSDAWLLKDRVGTNCTFSCLYATARDYARFGLVYENNGARGSNQIVPGSWVYDSTHSTEPHLQSSAMSDHYNFGDYGYQWWVGDGPRGDFAAVGLEGQNIYVSPSDDTVIVKLSDDLTIGTRGPELLKAYRAIADYLSTH